MRNSRRRNTTSYFLSTTFRELQRKLMKFAEKLHQEKTGYLDTKVLGKLLTLIHQKFLQIRGTSEAPEENEG